MRSVRKELTLLIGTLPQYLVPTVLLVRSAVYYRKKYTLSTQSMLKGTNKKRNGTNYEYLPTNKNISK